MMQNKIVKWQQYILFAYLCILLFVLPLYMHDKFRKLGAAKFEIFSKSSLAFFPLLIAGSLFLYLLIVYQEKRKGMIIQITLVDMMMILWGGCVVISYLTSSYKKEAFLGAGGWYMGLYAQILFLLLYVFVSRRCIGVKYLLSGTLIVSAITFLLGILNRFWIDPLHVYEGLSEDTCLQFLSTLGQATWYSSYLCATFPLAIGIYWYTKNKYLKFALSGYLLVAASTLVTQNSDSAFFALAAIMILLFWLSFEKYTDMKKFTEICIIVLFSFYFTGLLQKMFPQNSMKLDTLSIFFSQSGVIKVLLLAFFCFYIFLRSHENVPVQEWKFARDAILIVAGILFILLIFFIYCNTTGITARLFGFETTHSYLYFNDKWGSARGGSWKLAIRIFDEFPLGNKLFGVGPDSFSFYAYDNSVYAKILHNAWQNSTLRNVHNEFLNHLICYGIVGVTAYISLLVSVLVKFIKNRKKQPLLLGFALCILAYGAHNIFCYQQILSTTYIFLWIGMGEAILRKGENLKYFT